MKILVTGGLGSVGRPLVELLVKDGYTVKVIGRRPQAEAALVDAVNRKLAASSSQAGAEPAAPVRPDLRRATDDLLDALGVPAAERARPDPVHLRKRVALFTGGPRTGKTLAAMPSSDQ